MDIFPKQRIVSLLRSIGLNQYEAQAYASLLLFGDSTAGELSNRAMIPRARVYDIINRLEKKGFVIVQNGRPAKYRAIPPKEAIKTYLKNKEEEYKREFERIEKVAEELEKEGSSRIETGEEGGFWVLNTDSIMRTSMQNVLSESKNEIMAIITPEFLAEYGNTIIPLIEDACARGVNVKIIAPKRMAGALTIEGDVHVVETDTEMPPTILVDGKKAIMSIPRGKKAILVDHPEFSKTFKQMIENQLTFM